MLTLATRIASLARRRLGLAPSIVRVQLLGHNVLVQEGTFRPQPDYDDAWLVACALRSKRVYDIGAHTGDSALLILLATQVKQVVLVEANPRALAGAASNLIRNRVSMKANFVSAFAGDTDDSVVRFWTVGDGAAGSMYRSHAESAAKANSFEDVQTVTIDSLCVFYEADPDLIKIDVEGAEHKVLLGSGKCAARKTTRFLVELHANPDLPMRVNATNILDWCASVGYAAWYLKEGVLLADPEQISHRGRCHLLLQPAEWPYPDWLRGIAQGANPASLIPGADQAPSD